MFMKTDELMTKMQLQIKSCSNVVNESENKQTTTLIDFQLAAAIRLRSDLPAQSTDVPTKQKLRKPQNYIIVSRIFYECVLKTNITV